MATWFPQGIPSGSFALHVHVDGRLHGAHLFLIPRVFCRLSGAFSVKRLQCLAVAHTVFAVVREHYLVSYQSGSGFTWLGSCTKGTFQDTHQLPRNFMTILCSVSTVLVVSGGQLG